VQSRKEKPRRGHARSIKKLLITASVVVLFVRFSLDQTSLAINDHDETHFPISAVALLIDVERGYSGSEEASTSEVAAKCFDVNV
jgi:hypothetical protein